MEKIRKIALSPWVLPMVVVVGLAARMAASLKAYNYDMQSWYIVSAVERLGGNVYVETERYNYGPPWFLILHVLDLLSGYRYEVLRYIIAGFLSLADLGIFYLLYRKAGRLAAILFFLNPISIETTGYHCQFDNLAILIGLGAVLLFGDEFERPVDRRKFGGLLLLGLSITVKHLFFAFPLWLAIKQKGWWQKLIIMVVPTACFLLSFAPYWPVGHSGIIAHVFHFNSADTKWFYDFFVPACIQKLVSAKTLWFALLILFGFICRKRNSFESLLIYTGVLVAFSPATVDEFFAIPVVLVSVFPSVPFAVYVFFGALQVYGDVSCGGMGMYDWPHGGCPNLAIYSLCFALAWMLWRPAFLRLLQMIWQEVLFQWNSR